MSRICRRISLCFLFVLSIYLLYSSSYPKPSTPRVTFVRYDSFIHLYMCDITQQQQADIRTVGHSYFSYFIHVFLKCVIRVFVQIRSLGHDSCLHSHSCFLAQVPLSTVSSLLFSSNWSLVFSSNLIERNFSPLGEKLAPMGRVLCWVVSNLKEEDPP